MFGRVDDGVRRRRARCVAGTAPPEPGVRALGVLLTRPSARTVGRGRRDRGVRAGDARGRERSAAASTSASVSWSGSASSAGSGEQEMAVAGTLDLLDLLAVSGNRSQLSQALRRPASCSPTPGDTRRGALALLARRGMPTMPTRARTRAATTRVDLADLEKQLEANGHASAGTGEVH